MEDKNLYTIKEIADVLETDWETVLSWKYQYLFSLRFFLHDNQIKYDAHAVRMFSQLKRYKDQGLTGYQLSRLMENQDLEAAGA